MCPIDPFYYINSTSETMAPVDATNNYSNETSSSRAADVHVESITRVSSIPVVKSALGLASGLYSRVKGSSPIVGSGLSRAEQTVLLVADSAKPVFQRLEKPSKYILTSWSRNDPQMSWDALLKLDDHGLIDLFSSLDYCLAISQLRWLTCLPRTGQTGGEGPCDQEESRRD